MDCALFASDCQQPEISDVSAEGKRVLAYVPLRAQELSIGVVVNWPALLKK